MYSNSLLPRSILPTALVSCAMTACAPQRDLPQADPPLFKLEEELRITSDESRPETSLTPFHYMTVLGDGRIVTLHGSQVTIVNGITSHVLSQTSPEHRMRLFSADGKFVRFIGRQGNGPGEFKEMGPGGSVGDNLWASETRADKVVVLSANDSVVSVRRRPEIGAGIPTKVIALLAPNRQFVVRRHVSRETALSGKPFDPDSLVFAVEDSLGELVTRVAVHPASVHGPIFGDDEYGIPTRMDQRYTGKTRFAASDGGAHLVVASDAEVWGGQPGQVRLHIGDSSGRVAPVDISFAPVRVGEVSRKGLMSQMYVPEFSPVLSDVLIGRDGAVWMSAIYERDIWHVVVDGKRQKRVSTEGLQGVRIKSVSATKVWAVATDSLGVPSIVRYNVVPAAQEGSSR